MNIKKLGVLANIRKAEIREILTSVIKLFPDTTEIVGREKTAALLPPGKIEQADSFDGCDAVLALGGDGTLLRAARLVEEQEIPLLGIKIRSLGFLTEDEPERAVRDLLEDRYVIQERLRLDVAIMHEGKLRKSYSALNDAVIHGVGVSRVIRLKTTIDGAVLGEYLADGVIISTPTGSTAYSLAAGGPIVNPTSLAAFIITPLCPHSLSVRPVVVSADEIFNVELVENFQETLLTIDGQQTLEIEGGETVVFKRSPLVTRLIVTEGYNFYNLVSRKLRWGGVLRQH
jgi:NAD+ kinase